MAIIVRIVSADGKQVISRTLPALPSRIKVPAGAKVEVTDDATGQTVSLARYVNTHANRSNDQDKHLVHDNTKVTVETVDNWPEAERWLDSAGHSALSGSSDSTWFGGTDDGKGHTFGFDNSTLLVGGLVGGGAAVGALLLTSSNNPKDKTPPAPPSGLDFAPSDDTGSSNTDNITNKTSELTFGGIAEAGSSVELFAGATSLGKVTADANGAFVLDVSLEPGTHQITAKATDASGNTSSASTALSITVDTTAPGLVTGLDLADEDDVGLSNTDNITNKGTGLTITGVAEANAKVELFEGATRLGTATADSKGVFQLDISLGEGTHAITAKATDVAGNVGAESTALNITVDTTPPAAPTGLDLAAEDDNGASNTDNITTLQSGLTITGHTEPGARVELFSGTTSLGTAIADQDGLFMRDISLSLGTHQITARPTDIAGNTGPSSLALTITIIQPPASSSALAVDTHDTSTLAALLDSQSYTDDTSLHNSGSTFG